MILLGESFKGQSFIEEKSMKCAREMNDEIHQLSYNKKEVSTYNAATCRVKHQWFAGTQWQQLEDDDVGDQVVHGDGSSVLERQIIWQLVNVFGWNGTQLSPGAELWQRNNTISNLRSWINEIKNQSGMKIEMLLRVLLSLTRTAKPSTHLEVLDAFADSFDFSGALKTENGWRLWRWVDCTQAHH